MTPERSVPRGFVGDLYWHVHHEQLAEFLTEPIANRIAYIKSDKPKSEVPIRLKWMTPVLGEVPAGPSKARAAYDKAWAALVKARAAYDKAWAALVKARAAYDKARAAAQPALKRLHEAEHPGCPWDGKTIFPVQP
jgi:hypothetical protein